MTKHPERLPGRGGFPIGASMALSCMWQERNQEGIHTRHCL